MMIYKHVGFYYKVIKIGLPDWQDTSPTFKFVEMFAGQAEATRMFRYAEMPAARLDLLYMDAMENRQNPMDLTSDPGMANLGTTD